MRPRGHGWNVHRAQLLCIKKRSSQTRKLRAARCPAVAARPGLACLLSRGRRSVPRAARVTRVTQGERESLPPHCSPLHLEYSLPSGPWNVRNNTNISTQTSHVAHLDLMPRATAAGASCHGGRGRSFAKMRFPDARRRWSDCGKRSYFFSFHTETDCRRCPRQRDIRIKTTGAKLVDVEMEDYLQSPPPPPPPLPAKPPFPLSLLSSNVFSRCLFCPFIKEEG